MSKSTSAAAVRDRLAGALTTGTGRTTTLEPEPRGSVTTLASPTRVPMTIRDRAVTRPKRPERSVRVTVDLDPDIHQAVKVRLAEGSVTLAGVVRELLRRYDQDDQVRSDVLNNLYAEQR